MRSFFIVGGYDVPRRMTRACRLKTILVCLHVVLPVFPLVNVGGAELPVSSGSSMRAIRNLRVSNALSRLMTGQKTSPTQSGNWQMHFLPGPFHYYCREKTKSSIDCDRWSDTIALRIPADLVALQLLRAFGNGIAAPSANRFGHISPTQAIHVSEELGENVACILDGGPCTVGVESTILDLCSAASPREAGYTATARAAAFRHPLRGAARRRRPGSPAPGCVRCGAGNGYPGPCPCCCPRWRPGMSATTKDPLPLTPWTMPRLGAVVVKG